MNHPHLITFPALEPGRTQRSRLDAITSRSRSLRFRLRSERGAATAEYAITTLATVKP